MSVQESVSPQTKIARTLAFVAQLENRLPQIEQELFELAKAENEARETSLQELVRPDGVTSELAKVHRKQDALVKERQGILLDLPIAQKILASEQRKHDEAELAAHVQQARKLSKSQLEAWKRAGEKFAELVTIAAEIWKLALELDEYQQEILHKLSRTAREAWLQESRQPVQPLAIDLYAFAETLIDAAVDPHLQGYREGTRRLDDDSNLVRVIAKVGNPARPEFSGAVSTRKERPRASFR